MGRDETGRGSLSRRKAIRQPNKRVHILCEGSVTEPKYLDAFIRSIGARVAVPGLIRGGVGVPKTIVQKCIELKHQVELEARRSGFKNLDEVWAVFDVDEHDLSEALPLAKAHSIKCAISNPCIEVWGLLHEKEVDRPYHRHEAQRALAGSMPDFHHDNNPVFNWSWCTEKTLTAARNAVRGRTKRSAEGSDFPSGVPSTNFERLLASFDPKITDVSPDPTWSEWP